MYKVAVLTKYRIWFMLLCRKFSSASHLEFIKVSNVEDARGRHFDGWVKLYDFNDPETESVVKTRIRPLPMEDADFEILKPKNLTDGSENTKRSDDPQGFKFTEETGGF